VVVIEGAVIGELLLIPKPSNPCWSIVLLDPDISTAATLKNVEDVVLKTGLHGAVELTIPFTWSTAPPLPVVGTWESIFVNVTLAQPFTERVPEPA
jgi:hypothetical protein